MVVAVCSHCELAVEENGYSKRQWRKERNDRVCIICVDKANAAKREAREKRKIDSALAKKAKLEKKAKRDEKFQLELGVSFSNTPLLERPSLQQLQTCIDVLRWTDKNQKEFLEPQYKIVRKLLLSHSLINSQLESVKKHQLKKIERSSRNARKQKDLVHDRDRINKCKLRAERRAKLNALLHSTNSNVPLIPDGSVESTRTIENSQVRIETVKDQELSPCGGAEGEVGRIEGGDIDDYENGIIGSSEENMLKRPRSCYICKTRFQKLHHFYDQLCTDCSEINWFKRHQVADLHGRVVLLTGARVKIGFQCGLKLLRCGATLVATTRFPKDCAARYAAVDDFDTWKHRLMIFGLDLRDLASLERFCDVLKEKLPRLDAIINNACQTIRRPTSYYSHLMEIESTPVCNLPLQLNVLLAANERFNENLLSNEKSGIACLQSAQLLQSKIDEKNELLLNKKQLDSMSSAEKSQVVLTPSDNLSVEERERLFPKNVFDVNGQQVDLRRRNTWLLKLDEVETPEIAEVFAINALAPFVINSRLKPLMMKAKEQPTHVGNERGPCPRFIVNVSAMEGKFYRYKNANHPHTNMAKAALNMMTRTSASQYARDGIYMTSVDTGWINDENPLEKAATIAKENNFQTPIDEVDAAARVLDPLLMGVNGGELIYGKFLKDYRESEW
eukprot:g3222.t1